MTEPAEAIDEAMEFNSFAFGGGCFIVESIATGVRFEFRLIRRGRSAYAVRLRNPRRLIGEITGAGFRPSDGAKDSTAARGFAWLASRITTSGLIPSEVDVVPIHSRVKPWKRGRAKGK